MSKKQVLRSARLHCDLVSDPEDRHVLAAAISGHVDAIVTWNEKDFPREVLDPFGIEVQTPDEFVLNQLMLEKLTALAALKRMRERWA
ncbi:putative nucleic acid-binding protein [Variovorax boronicumulans]|uniref:PIN domain-containing protein n=1 Tax=Variovorax boronicumulans TaxID=436515 RepID=UPI00278424B3|nr:PIN domain-containing protein [Variovorax boronicumulans]MDQ0086535.1 putative nucleic acid-binding protein [Variovorax boronicumulans]